MTSLSNIYITFLVEINGCDFAEVKCFNGGSCEARGSSYTCNCADGYIGTHCGEENVFTFIFFLESLTNFLPFFLKKSPAKCLSGFSSYH